MRQSRMKGGQVKWGRTGRLGSNVSVKIGAGGSCVPFSFLPLNFLELLAFLPMGSKASS